MKTDSSGFEARLWKIGGSVVFTLPVDMVSEYEDVFVDVNMSVGERKTVYMMKPWKCGGSFVVTVPKQHVDAFGLMNVVKHKGKVKITLNGVKSR